METLDVLPRKDGDGPADWERRTPRPCMVVWYAAFPKRWRAYGGSRAFLNISDHVQVFLCGAHCCSRARLCFAFATDRKTYEGRTFRTFFLTFVFDSAGTDWVKEDKKVSLDLRLFQGYDVKAFSMKAFDVRGDGTEFRMLSPEEFLSKTNANRVTGCLPVVDSSFRMSKPLVQFNSPMDLLPGVVKRYREDFLKLPPDQQTDCVFLPFEAGSKSRRQMPFATTWNVGRENSQGSAIALDEDNDEDEEGGSAGPHDDGGNEANRVRPQELWDSGDEGEGVDPRMPEDADEPVQRVAPIDTTRCFFLEYDDQGFATQDVHALHVDVMRIKRIPRGRILFNHRSLSENIVRGIENAIESSISTDPGAWDRPELVLAPIDRNDIVGGQGRRITPTEFLERDPAEFDWYAVCGQHTVEAMKRLVRKGSPAVKVYGLNAYSKVRVVYFGDDQTRGYFNVSCFDNTRENRSMMLSFEDAVRDIKQWWIDNNRIEAPKAKISEKDEVAVAHQKTGQNFLRACMGKACDKAFVKQALENEYSKDWSNRLRGYMNLATSSFKWN
ncbi:hypothetical protein CBR_g22208 [Chara braunii]|uniref:Uncharacterized protein n=1 Tax=Chara braunii TaxID=69332 RepID=A0A388L2C2_CHABU|nr:hypothetical protein CBR_g22208 [Chara braunii]|eukprot:GBG76460.1 hypothetical protein CBR_g22208 [Chara braunii]